MLRASKELRRQVYERRINGERQYDLARRVGLHPSLVSHILNSSIPIQRSDTRILRLADAVGVPADRAFEEVPDEP